MQYNVDSSIICNIFKSKQPCRLRRVTHLKIAILTDLICRISPLELP